MPGPPREENRRYPPSRNSKVIDVKGTEVRELLTYKKFKMLPAGKSRTVLSHPLELIDTGARSFLCWLKVKHTGTEGLAKCPLYLNSCRPSAVKSI